VSKKKKVSERGPGERGNIKKGGGSMHSTVLSEITRRSRGRAGEETDVRRKKNSWSAKRIGLTNAGRNGAEAKEERRGRRGKKKK